MGAWGHGIRQDDVVCDVIGAFEEGLKQGKSIAQATKAVRKQFDEATKDCDDGPLVWIGLAYAQWTYGELDSGVLQHVKEDLESGRSLSRWGEDKTALSRRKAVLTRFIEKIEKPKVRPKKPPRTISRSPKFQPGDCLSIQLSNGQFGAAIVLAIDQSSAEFGMDFIGVLDYMSPHEPSEHIFRQRKWLYRSHHDWNNDLDVAWYTHVGYRKMKPRLKLIGSVELLKSDPKPRMEGIGYCAWQRLGEQVVLQRDWDSKR